MTMYDRIDAAMGLTDAPATAAHLFQWFESRKRPMSEQRADIYNQLEYSLANVGIALRAAGRDYAPAPLELINLADAVSTLRTITALMLERIDHIKGEDETA